MALRLDAAWLALGVTFIYAAAYGPGRADGRGRDFGIGITAVAVTLSTLRLVFVVRRWRASRTRSPGAR